MQNVSLARRTFLSALAALTLFAGALFVAAPKASASMGECASNHVCIWSGTNFSGTFSQWSVSENGCHNHIFNPKFKSGWNNTSLGVHFGNFGATPAGESFTTGGLAFEGEICW